MHGVNLDLLHTLPHYPDGRPKDPHAHHRAELLAQARRDRRARWQGRITRLRNLFARRAEPMADPCPDLHP